MAIFKPVIFVLLLYWAFPGPSGLADDNRMSEACLIEKGTASWYGTYFHGKQTASGEFYDMQTLTAAHKSLPFNTMVKVKNVRNGKTVTVRINNRGPFVEGRVIDLSYKAARRLDMIEKGVVNVELYLVKEGNGPVQCRN